MRGRAAFVLGAFVVLDVWAQNAVPTPPPTRRDDMREVMHGVEIVDPYRWREDGKSPETRAWIDAQNAYTQAVVGARPGRAVIRERIAGLARFDTQSVPPRRGRR